MVERGKVVCAFPLSRADSMNVGTTAGSPYWLVTATLPLHYSSLESLVGASYTVLVALLAHLDF